MAKSLAVPVLALIRNRTGTWAYNIISNEEKETERGETLFNRLFLS